MISMPHKHSRGGAKQSGHVTARMGTILLASSVLFASPAVAGCLGHPEDNFCYTAGASFRHSTDPGFYEADAHSGATPQTASTLVRDQGWASASADSAHNGTLEVTTVLGDDDYYGATADASLTYSFRLTSIGGGVPNGTLIPLHVIASAISLAMQTPLSGYHASFEMDQDGSRVAFASEKILRGREVDLFTFDQWINVKPDDDLMVTMHASSSIFSSPGAGRLATGILVDPVFEIGPEYASQYKLVGLPLGSQTPSGVPEPASWGMMMAGFGLVGSAMRRRRTRVCFA